MSARRAAPPGSGGPGRRFPPAAARLMGRRWPRAAARWRDAEPLSRSRFPPSLPPDGASPAEPLAAELLQTGDAPGRDWGSPGAAARPFAGTSCHAQEGHDQPSAPGAAQGPPGAPLTRERFTQPGACAPGCPAPPAARTDAAPRPPALQGVGAAAPRSARTVPPRSSSARHVPSCPGRPLARPAQRGGLRRRLLPRRRAAGDRGAEAAAGGAEAESGRRGSVPVGRSARAAPLPRCPAPARASLHPPPPPSPWGRAPGRGAGPRVRHPQPGELRQPGDQPLHRQLRLLARQRLQVLRGPLPRLQGWLGTGASAGPCRGDASCGCLAAPAGWRRGRSRRWRSC